MADYKGIRADHHVFVVPGIVDPDVVRAQAQRALDKKGESTYIHHHSKYVLDQDGLETPNEVQCLGRDHTEVGKVSHVVKLP